jgi:hypothetical protein
VATDGSNFEVGIGRLVYGSPDQITRDIIVSSSNAGSAVSWLTGTRQVYAFELSGSAYPLPFTIGFTLDQSYWGSDLVFTGNEPQTLTLPALNTVPAGWAFTLKNSSNALLTLAPQDTDQIENFGTGSEWIVPPGAGAQVTPDQTSVLWRLISITPPKAGIGNVTDFTSDVTAHVSSWNNVYIFTGSSAASLTLPVFDDVPDGYLIELKNDGTAPVTIMPADTGTDAIEDLGAGVGFTVHCNASMQIRPDQTVWRILQTFPHGYDRVTVVTASGTMTPTLNQSVIVINKTVPAATAVTLPTSPPVGKTYSIIDGAGNANTYNITLSGSANIDGSASYVVSTNWGSAALIWNGTIWNVLNRVVPAPSNTQPIRVITSGSSVTATDSDGVIVMNLGTPAASTVALPASPLTGQSITVVDGAGNAYTYNITVTASATINGNSSWTIGSNYNAVTFAYNGSTWNVINRFTNGAFGL